MEQPQPSVPFWDAVRAWADAAGLLLPRPQADGDQADGDQAARRPAVPASVCENCPICQGAATLDQVDPRVITELAELARGVLGGIGSALASAAEQRLASGTQKAPTGERDEEDLTGRGGDESAEEDPGA